MSPVVLAPAGALLLAVVHIFAGKLRFLDSIPRSRWLSFASGVSVAFVFLHLLPELDAAQDAMREELGDPAGFLRHRIYVLAALGLTVFYGLERLAERSRMRRRVEEGEDRTEPGVFWAHTGAFALYNGVIGYLLGEEAAEPRSYVLFLVAIAVHFVVNDYGLRQHHKSLYDRRGRWALAAAVLLGAGVGASFRVPYMYLLVPLAFVAGAIILNVLKEELPNDRQSRFWAFALGVSAYGALLMAI